MNSEEMTTRMIVGGIREVAKGIIELIPKLRAARREKRLRIADLMEQISESLVEVSAEIRSGNQPHGQCGQILGYAEQLPRVLKSVVGNTRAEALGEQLNASHAVEILAMRMERIKNKEPYLAKLEEAGGKFRAVAHMLRV